MRIKQRFKTSEGRLLFMSDLHYGHENVIRFDGRPFSGVEDMNNHIEGVLKSIGPTDTLFDLGDLFWRCPEDKMCNIMGSFKPRAFYKVLGNHDKRNVYVKSKVSTYLEEEPFDLLEINVEHEGKLYFLVLSHYPMVSWNGKTHGSLMIHGHCHGNIDEFNESSSDLRVDVGFSGALAKETGTFLIDFIDVLNYFKKKAGGEEFDKWTMNKCKEL